MAAGLFYAPALSRVLAWICCTGRLVANTITKHGHTVCLIALIISFLPYFFRSVAQRAQSEGISGLQQVS